MLFCFIRAICPRPEACETWIPEQNHFIIEIVWGKYVFLSLNKQHLTKANLFPAVRSDDYFIAGRAIAVSLVHGGPPPRFLATELYDALVRGPENVTCDFQKIPDEDLKSKLEKVSMFIKM